MLLKTLASIFVAIFYLCAGADALANDFSTWIQQFKLTGSQRGISDATLQVLETLTFNDQVIRLDRKQPESILSLSAYQAKLKPLLGPAKKALHQHQKMLAGISQRYNVPAEYIVALWGIESNFSQNMGNFDVLSSLATLAFEGRRAKLFQEELLILLTLIDSGKLAQNKPIGSWAGAMGQCQFMPSSIRDKAVDADRDGIIDLWHSKTDALASIANYLHLEGWNPNERWGRPVKLPRHFDMNLISLEQTMSLTEWNKRGIRAIDGSPLPNSSIQASLI
ncbi:MAG: lytic murein transglycosylase, partial [Alphaproteobacteria bacterium]|nr:lytic murein transglycosylase [Alphaproteobacteria bacterium]